MIQTGASQTCTFQPSVFAATCPISGGAGVMASGATVTTVRSAATPGGALRARATLDVTNGTATTYQAFARAGYYDALTLGGTEQAAVARFSVVADGAGSASTDYAAMDPAWTPYGIFFIANYGTTSVPSAYGVTPTPAVSQLLVPANVGTTVGFVDVPVTMGLNNLLIAFSAVARVGRPTSVAAGAPWSGTATADYLNTAHLTGVRFLDAQGRDVTAGVTATFASGALATTTPEPGTWALCATGLVGIGAAARRRRSRAG